MSEKVLGLGFGEKVRRGGDSFFPSAYIPMSPCDSVTYFPYQPLRWSPMKGKVLSGGAAERIKGNAV